MKKILVVIALVAISLLMFTSCEDNTPKVYTVSFDANGGSGTMPEQTFIEGTAKALTPNGFIAPSGMKFDKWNTAVDGSGTNYTDSVSYTATGDITLYAVWSYKIGEIGPSGGYIFYDVDADNDSTNDGRGPDNLSSSTTQAFMDGETTVTPAGWRYLEVASSDCTVDGVNGSYYEWGPDGSYNTKTGIGEGYNNTIIMKEKGDTSGVGTNAHKACYDYSITNNGIVYDNWFLPSKDELYLIYENLHSQRLGISGLNYWSSSEHDTNTSAAWYMRIDNGIPYLYGRYGNNYYVRAIRAF